MDVNPRSPVVRFGPERRATAAVAALGLLTLVIAFATDAAGRLLLVAATVLLFGYGLSDLLFRPRLVADAAGLTVRAPLQRVHLDWSQIEAVRADVRHRHGLRTVALEIDAGELLIVLSRRSLGADPEEVADLVNALDPRRWTPDASR